MWKRKAGSPENFPGSNTTSSRREALPHYGATRPCSLSSIPGCFCDISVSSSVLPPPRTFYPEISQWKKSSSDLSGNLVVARRAARYFLDSHSIPRSILPVCLTYIYTRLGFRTIRRRKPLRVFRIRESLNGKGRPVSVILCALINQSLYLEYNNTPDSTEKRVDKRRRVLPGVISQKCQRQGDGFADRTRRAVLCRIYFQRGGSYYFSRALKPCFPAAPARAFLRF